MKKHLPVLAFLVCFGSFAFGLGHLFKLRFESGDVYPPYSSLRADPLGTMAFCEALQRMPGVSVRRDFSANNTLPDGRDTAYLHLGARTHEWQAIPDETFKTIEGFVTGGGRLAVTFFPETAKPFRFFPDTDEEKPTTKGKNKTDAKRPVEEKRDKTQIRNFLKEQWGLELGFRTLEPGSTTVEHRGDDDLPQTLEWHSAAIFTNVSKSWHTIYARGTNPVVVERRLGSGTVVMATDSYFLSNEAMLKDRHAPLLSWCVGPAPRVVFDEAHLGIVESEGVATLLRKYRLQGLAAGLVFLAGLFIWKNSLSLVPPTEPARTENQILGRDASSGFVNLLRRNVAARDLLAVSFAEWQKSCAQGHSATRQAQAEAALKSEFARPPRERKSLETYQAICRILKKI